MPDLQSAGCKFESRPSTPSGSINEHQLWLGRQRQVWLIQCANETHGVQVILCYPVTMHAISERLRDASYGGAIQIDYLYLLKAVKAERITNRQCTE